MKTDPGMAVSKKRKNIWLNIGIAVFWGVIFFLLFSLRSIITPFFIALLLSYLLMPPVKFLSAGKIPLPLAVALIYLSLGAAFFLLCYFALPTLAEDVSRFLAVVPEFEGYFQDIKLSLTEIMAKLNLPSDIADGVFGFFDGGALHLRRIVEKMAFSAAKSLKLFLSLLLAPVLSYYMIRDADAAGKKIVSWLPPDCREEILRISADINHIVRQFIYGYLSVSFIVALLSFILLKIIGVDSPGLLGVIVGVADLIPYFGPFIGAIPAIIIAFAKGPLTALLAALALGAVQQLESLVISPKIIGSRTGLHPLTVIFVVLAGGYYFGVGGMILSVPLTAALKLLLAFIYSRAVAWRES